MLKIAANRIVWWISPLEAIAIAMLPPMNLTCTRRNIAILVVFFSLRNFFFPAILECCQTMLPRNRLKAQCFDRFKQFRPIPFHRSIFVQTKRSKMYRQQHWENQSKCAPTKQPKMWFWFLSSWRETKNSVSGCQRPYTRLFNLTYLSPIYSTVDVLYIRIFSLQKRPREE